MIHKMRLFNEPYELIKRGLKTIELRLYDDKRQKILPDDTIIFINVETHKRLAVRVKDRHIYKKLKPSKSIRELPKVTDCSKVFFFFPVNFLFFFNLIYL